MKLYHGSNEVVREPEILDSYRTLDFGGGFYLTSNMSQAQKFSSAVVGRVGRGVKTVSVYDFDQDMAKECCNIKVFTEPGEEWFDYVVNNRCDNTLDDYDIVVGPVANDKVYFVVRGFENGIYDRAEALKRFKAYDLYDQYTFKTRKALEYLHFVEHFEVKNE